MKTLTFQRTFSAIFIVLGLLCSSIVHAEDEIEETTLALEAIPIIEGKAKSGNAEYQLKLGQMYLTGMGVNLDTQKALYWLEKSAETNSDAQLTLSGVYLSGLGEYDTLGIEIDKQKGIEWLKKAAETNTKAQPALGLFYLEGKVVPVDTEKGLYWLEKAAETDSDIQFLLGMLYLEDFMDDDIQLEPDYNKALYWLEKSAENNNIEAQWFLADGLANGIILKQDTKRALPWMIKAAENGVYGAMEQLPFMYRFGRGTEIDYKQSFIWKKRFVEAIIPEEMMLQIDSFYIAELSAMYYCGMGVEQNFAEAEKWKLVAKEMGGKERAYLYGEVCAEVGNYELAFPKIKEAANQGNIRSQRYLGWLYRQGKGVEQDYQQAMYWYQQAHEKGNAIATNNIGDMYENGDGVPVDYAKAREYYMQVVELEEPYGYFSMGQLYKLGRGVKKDLNVAKDWYQKSCDMGLAVGCEEAEAIEDELAK